MGELKYVYYPLTVMFGMARKKNQFLVQNRCAWGLDAGLDAGYL